MGSAIAERLHACGVRLGVFDISDEAVTRFRASLNDPASLAPVDECTLLITSLPNDAVVTAELLETGRLERLTGGLLVEMSTLLPATMKLVELRAQALNVAVVDAPVSGGPSDARAGRLTLFVGADVESLMRARPVLELLGTVKASGAVGDAKAIKIVNNMMSMGNMAVAAEAFSLGLKMGLDPQAAYDLLAQAGGSSNHFVKRMPNAIAGNFAPGFSQVLAAKDLNLALTSAASAGVDLPLTSAVLERYRAGLAAGLGGEDIVALVKLYGAGAQPPRQTRGAGTRLGHQEVM